MKLYFRRRLHQDTKGIISRQTVTKFLLHARAELTPEEARLANEYQLVRYFIWERSEAEIRAIAESGRQPTPDTIRLDRLSGEGVNVVFDSLTIMLNAEDQIKRRCRELADLMTEVRTFNEEQVLEF